MQHDPTIKVTIRTPTSTRPIQQAERRQNANVDWLAPLLTLPVLIESLLTGLAAQPANSYNPNIKLAFENTRIPTEREKDEKCPICQETFAEKQITTLPTCLHNFHKTCIEEAAKYNSICPICRTDIPILEE